MAGLTVERVVTASPDRVWAAWTEPDRLAAWFWPPRFQTTAAMEARDGGAFRIASGPVGMGVSGVIEEVRPSGGFATSWRWDGEDEQTRVTVALVEQPDGSTLVRVHHDGFADEQAVAHHIQGWNDCLTRLAAAFA